MISLILAIDPNRVIGRNRDLPWHYPRDLRYFKAVTLHHKVLMGRTTFDSILARNGRPLPDRENLVVTHSKIDRPDVTVVSDLAAFLAEPREEEVFVIGGKTIFEQAWPHADRLYVTHVRKAHEGDIRLDGFNLDGFALCSSKEDAELVFAVYERIR